MSTSTVRAKCWNLHIDEIGVIQSRNLYGPSRWSANIRRHSPGATRLGMK
jgi:hypothetical protein